MYKPNPIDTSNVALAESVLELAEKLAANTHDLWSRERISQGWIYGPERNDTLKTHPDLVPYDELPESEREYDRITALEALKAIQVLGYRLIKT